MKFCSVCSDILGVYEEGICNSCKNKDFGVLRENLIRYWNIKLGFDRKKAEEVVELQLRRARSGSIY